MPITSHEYALKARSLRILFYRYIPLDLPEVWQTECPKTLSLYAKAKHCLLKSRAISPLEGLFRVGVRTTRFDARRIDAM